MHENLTAKEIIRIHQNPIRSFNLTGLKKIVPENTLEEETQVKNALEYFRKVLREDRVERRNIRIEAEWLPDIKEARVTRKVGNIFPHYGCERNGEIFLKPEEALFLLEMNRLELQWNGIPFSIEQGYAVLVGKDTNCTLEQYRVYQDLAVQGFLMQQSKQSNNISQSDNDIETKKRKLEISESVTQTLSGSSKTEFTDVIQRLKADGPSTSNLNRDNDFNYCIYSPDTTSRKGIGKYKLKIESDKKELLQEDIGTNKSSVLTAVSGINSVSFFQLQSIDLDNP